MPVEHKSLPKELKPVFEKAGRGSVPDIIKLADKGFVEHAKESIRRSFADNYHNSLFSGTKALHEKGLLNVIKPDDVGEAILTATAWGTIFKNAPLLKEVGLLKQEHIDKMLERNWHNTVFENAVPLKEAGLLTQEHISEALHDGQHYNVFWNNTLPELLKAELITPEHITEALHTGGYPLVFRNAEALHKAGALKKEHIDGFRQRGWQVFMFRNAVELAKAGLLTSADVSRAIEQGMHGFIFEHIDSLTKAGLLLEKHKKILEKYGYVFHCV